MKKFLILFIAVFALCSCSNNDKHAYLVTIDAPATYYVGDMRQTTKHEPDYKDLGIVEDSISTFVTNIENKEIEYTKEIMDMYYESLNTKCKNEVDFGVEEIKRATYKSILGRMSILIIIPESVVSKPSIDDLLKLYKGFNPEIESHCIYEGSALLAELEMKEDYKRIREEYDY